MLEQRIEEIVETPLKDMGYLVVRVKYNRKHLQIMIENKDVEQPINIDDCEKASKLISRLLDVEDLISDSYDLEISSPGVDRPLVKMSDFERFRGSEARVKLYTNINGVKKISGVIEKVGSETITLKSGEEIVEIPFSNVSSANLIPDLQF